MKRRNPDMDLGPLLLMAGAAFILLRGGGLKFAGRSSPTAIAPSSSTSPVGVPSPVPVPIGTPLPPVAPFNAGAGSWALDPGGPTGMQWVWVATPGAPAPLFGPAPVPVMGLAPTPPPNPPIPLAGHWQLTAGGPSAMEWTWTTDTGIFG